MEFNLTQRHIMALNILLIGVLAYFATLSAKDVMALQQGSLETPLARGASPIADTSPINHPRQAYQAIVDRDIFNLVPVQTDPPPVVVEDLNLNLVGVTQVSRGKPYAIVQDRSGQQAVYRVGETIPDAGELVEVDKDRAVVEANGKRVAINLPKDDLTGPDSASSSSESAHTPFGFRDRRARRQRPLRRMGAQEEGRRVQIDGRGPEGRAESSD